MTPHEIDNGDPQSSDIQSITSIDRLIHEPARLLIMSVLYVVESGDYTFLMGQTGLTWGNLSSHISKLEDAGFLEVEKVFKKKKPYTMLRLTDSGREAFKAYRQRMMHLFKGLPD